MKLIAAILFLPLLVLSPTISSAQFEGQDNRILNEFIVLLKPAHSIDALLQNFPSLKNKEVLSARMNIFLLERNSTTSPDEFLLSLQRNENVKLAQFNHQNIKERGLIPNDAHFGEQWNMLNTGQGGGLPGADIEATEAWAINHDAITAAGDSVVIAIVDGSMDLNHEDINYFTNYSEVPGNGIDDDGNGYIDDINGWNAVQNNGNVQGGNSHSMLIGGIAGAKGDDSVGVAGVCWGAKIMPVIYGSATESAVVKAYNYVREMRILYNTTFGTKGAYIVATNSSFGLDFANPVGYPIWCLMYDSLGYVGILSAAATANTNVNVDVQHDMPTECPSNYLITVTNTTRTDALNSGAGYGKTSIDLGAPGTYPYSTLSGNAYGSPQTGTSFSAPHLAGTVAAMYSAACNGLIDYSYEHPDSAALIIRQYILDGAEWVSSMNNKTVTNGRLNLYRALVNLNRYNCDSCNFDLRIDKVDITCSDTHDGALAAVFSPGNWSDFDIRWTNTGTSPEILNLSAGFYSVNVTDTFGCRRTFTAELHQPDSIIINNVSITAPTDSTNGNLIISAFSYNEPLLYSIDGINYQQTPVFSFDSFGSYTVYVKNTLGCVVERSVIVSGLDELRIADYELRVNPNPASNELNIYTSLFTAEKTSLKIFDAIGQVVYEAVPLIDNCQLSIVNFANGIYLISLQSSHVKLTRKFVVNK